MSPTDRLRQDLDYVANAVRRNEHSGSIPPIYFMWAVIVAIGFALPDFAPPLAGPFWLVFGILGGLASWWLGAREERRTGHRDLELGRRWGYHWMVGGLGFMVCWLPVLGGAPIEAVAGNFLLVAGLTYALAGVHLERPLLWSGLLMLAAFVVLSLFALPYTWTFTGIMIGLSLAWAGLSARRQRLPAVHP